MQLRPLALGMMTAASLSIAACHNEEPQTSSGAQAELQAGTTVGTHACPMSVPGTTVTATDVSTGIALDLSTTAGPNEVAELQRRVQMMASAGTMGLMRGPGAGAGRAGRAASREASTTPRPRSRVENTPTGARVTLEPADAQGIDALRTRVRAHLPRMASNDACARARSSP